MTNQPYRLYARSVCDMNSASAAVVCGLWCYTSVICLCLRLWWQRQVRVSDLSMAVLDIAVGESWTRDPSTTTSPML